MIALLILPETELTRILRGIGVMLFGLTALLLRQLPDATETRAGA